MTDRVPASDLLPEEREERTISSESVARPASAGMATGGMATLEEPVTVSGQELELAYEHGVELQARSQWAYARMRFFRHKLAVTSLIILIAFGLVALFAGVVAPYTEDWQPPFDANYLNSLNQAPSVDHPFGTDQLGRDYFSRVIYGVQTSLGVAIVVALLATLLGTARRRSRRLLRRRDRQRAHALHRPDPHRSGPRRAARRRCVPRLLGGRGAARARLVQHPAAHGDRPHPRLPLLDRNRAHRARVCSSRCARRSSSRQPRRQGAATAASSCGTSSPTASARSSSTRR